MVVDKPIVVKLVYVERERVSRYRIYVCVEQMLCIQGDSGGICETSGNDGMCDSKQKSSYEHGSDFERLRSYDRLKLRIEGNDY